MVTMEEILQVFTQTMRDALGKAIEDVSRKYDPTAQEVNVRKEIGAVEEAKMVGEALAGGFLDVLDDGDFCNEFWGQIKEQPHVIRTVTVDMNEKDARGIPKHQFPVTVSAVVNSGNAGWQCVVEFQVQRPRERWQLLGVGIKRDVAPAFLDDLKILTITGLEREMFHEPARVMARNLQSEAGPLKAENARRDF